jgi:hypothetical protein
VQAAACFGPPQKVKENTMKLFLILSLMLHASITVGPLLILHILITYGWVKS